MPALKNIGDVVARVLKTKPVRAFTSYSAGRGPILASGLAYSALFSVFAGIALLFSIAGLVLAGDVALQEQLIGTLSSSIPGLIDTGDGAGAINPDDLLESQAFNLTGIIALLGLLFTALGFLASARDAIREMFHLPSATGNFLVMKLKDLVFLVGFAVTLVITTALSIIGTAATGFVLDLVGIGRDSMTGTVLGRIVTLALVVAIDSTVIAVMLRLLALVRIPFRYLRGGALIGGVGVALLTVLFQLGVVGGATSNPLLGSFVVIIGLLIFFNFLCQILLISAAWVATGLADNEVTVNDKQAKRMPRGKRPRRRTTTGLVGRSH